MKYRTLGKTGLKVSEIGFGGWAIGGSWGPQDDNESVNALHTAIDQGVNFIDTAAGYGNGKSEKIIADILQSRKEEIIVCTKTPPVEGIWPPSPYCNIEERYPEKYLRENVEERLSNLKTDCLDVLLLHTWTRAWNNNPIALEILQELKKEGKIKAIGVSTPEQDQNCVVDLMRNGHVDVVQVIYNIFEQEPAAGILPISKENNVGVMVRVAFDEGVLTGKYKAGSKFGEGDFRNSYFEGDRLGRAVARVEKIKQEIEGTNLTMPQLSLKYPLMHDAVSAVIPGIRNNFQANANTAVSDLDNLSEDLLKRLQKHSWQRGVWYSGK